MSVSLHDYSTLNAIHGAARVTPSQAREAGAYTFQTVKSPYMPGGQTEIPYQVTKEQSASSGHLHAEADENAVRNLENARRKPLYSPGRALQLTMQRLATQKSAPGIARVGEQKSMQEAAKNWVRLSRYMSAKTKWKTGIALINKINPKMFDDIDQDGELRLGLKQYKPKDLHALRFNAEETIQRRPQPQLRKSIPLPTSSLRGSLMRNYSALSSMHTFGAADIISTVAPHLSLGIKVAQVGLGLVKEAMTPSPSPSRPRPMMAPRRRMGGPSPM